MQPDEDRRMPKKILVSGASGFIAGHVVERLLARGDHVVGTVRDPADDRKNRHLRALPGAERLTLVAADLTAPDPFTAHADVDGVMHLASPYAIDVTDPQRDLVEPAVQGTLSMLRAAAAHPRVKRVVLTSSMAAVTDSPDGRVLTDRDWNTESSLTRNPYYYSKTLAERAAWDFMAAAPRGFDLVAINPFLVIGPSHTAAVNTSPQTLVDMLAGSYPAVMALTWGFVDVRDVAAAHVAALDTPTATGRYLCVAGNMDMADTIRAMRDLGYRGKLPKLRLDNPAGTAMMKLASRFQPVGVGTYLRTHLGKVPRYDATRVTRDLGVAYRPVGQSLADTLADLVRWGHIAAPDS
jgi:dihydroflavonol-4-reductase